MTLDEVPFGVEADVVALGIGGWERRRLLELGLVPGTRVRAVAVSPLRDPVAYRIRGAVIALRRAQARAVEVRLVEMVGAGDAWSAGEPA